MRGPLEHDAEGVGLTSTAAFDLGAHRLRVAHAPLAQVVRKRDGVAVQVQDQARHAIACAGAQPKSGGEGHHGQRMCGVQITVKNLVANRGPARFTAQLNIEIVFGEQPKLLRHDERRGIDERDESDTERF
jgi:hypothetical protein